MTRLDTQSAERLARVLGMLGSAHDGERAAAGLKANQLVRDLGLTWSDIIVPPDLARADNSAPEPHNDWERMVQHCHRCRGRLSERERTFVEAMRHWRSTPTERQQNWLSDIYSKLCRRGRQ